MSAETTIVTAIHNIKSNHGSDTPGVDNKTMRREYLQKPYRWVINDIQRAFEKFEAQKIRRKYIDKPGKRKSVRCGYSYNTGPHCTGMYAYRVGTYCRSAIL